MSDRPHRDESQWAASGIEDLGAASAQFARLAARGQAELLSLVSRRASSYLEFPARLTQCRSLTDLWREQLGFLATMQRHYFEAAHHVLEPLDQRAPEPKSRAGNEPAVLKNPQAVAGGEGPERDAGQGTPRAA